MAPLVETTVAKTAQTARSATNDPRGIGVTGPSGTVPIDHEGPAEMALLEWSPITEADLDQLKALAAICLERDGGLPSLASEETLRAFFYSGEAIGG